VGGIIRTIGSWGNDLVFKVSSKQVITFKSIQRTVSNRWSEHTALYGKPAREFQGADLETLKMTVTLFAFLGTDIPRILKNLENCVNTGKANYLTLGGRKIGDGKYTLDEVSETFEYVTNMGKLIECDVSLTFKEYT
jgi:hypothetical protein